MLLLLATADAHHLLACDSAALGNACTAKVLQTENR